MTPTAEPASTSDRELVLTRLIDAPREKLFGAWTDPDLLKQWFAPLPYTTPVAELEVRPGGANLIVMRGPDGNDMPIRGIYLEIVEYERLVFTDAYTTAWEPSQKPFMTVIVTFEDEGGKTRYTARVRHWTVADREAHEKMGFHEGWGGAPTSSRLSSPASECRAGDTRTACGRLHANRTSTTSRLRRNWPRNWPVLDAGAAARGCVNDFDNTHG